LALDYHEAFSKRPTRISGLENTKVAFREVPFVCSARITTHSKTDRIWMRWARSRVLGDDGFGLPHQALADLRGVITPSISKRLISALLDRLAQKGHRRPSSACLPSAP
jgi:hypothetical protein